MSVYFSASSQGLSRAGSFPDYTGDGDWGIGMQGWFRMDTQPTGAQYLPIWLYGDPTLSNPYIRVFIDADGVKQHIWDGTTLHTTAGSAIFPTNRWLFLLWKWYPTGTPKGVFYENKSYLFRILAGDPQIITAVNLTTIPWVETEERVGRDDSGSANMIVGLRAENVRTFNSSLGDFGTFTGDSGELAQMDQYNLSLVLSGPTYPPVVPDLSDVLACTSLYTTSDLTDASGHSHNWSNVGTPVSTPTYSPFILETSPMVENFNDGTLSNFTTRTQQNLAGVGINRSCAMGCSGTDGPWRVIGNDSQGYYTEGSVDFTYAMKTGSVSGGDQIQAFQANWMVRRNGFSVFIGRGMAVAILLHLPDGAVTLQTLSGNGESDPAVEVTTAAGTVPIDGTPFQLTANWRLVAGVVTLESYVNGVFIGTVSSPSVAWSYPQYNYWFVAANNAAVISTWASAIDNVRFTPVWRGLTAGSPAGMDQLQLVCGIPQPTITDVSADCVAKRIVITGTGFVSIEYTTVTVQVEGDPPTNLEHTILSVTPTKIVVSVPDFVADARYCISAGNTTDCDGFNPL